MLPTAAPVVEPLGVEELARRFREMTGANIRNAVLGRWKRQEDRWVRGKSTLILKPRHFLGSPWHP